MGYLFGICVEKNSELPAGHPSRKFKGRVVFQGNRVVDQNWQRAVFEDLGNSPATMDASRAADCYGCAPGHSIQQADAEQAYIQAESEGHPLLGLPAARPAPRCLVQVPTAGVSFGQSPLLGIPTVGLTGSSTVTSG
jgi:hypothetical protein